ncbi:MULTISPECIES: chemoreceptor glutamine deamidase CheD [Pseudomonas syringae group]|uniref:Probable chemoreceptor glutamine deamidase CheD n=1 Tax=Pseudomonas syringae pv. actinidiae TaxID=103796 RepID=A0A7Z6U5D3_PSESF|nr:MULTISPECIES: chemoreceptor glutamine deamidase CheD [Pseudomonas syringae group]MDU8543594.1 chemoreceptor glutamine deamidase CheD [Pseudomonas syringae group sp. J248-6]RMP76868.1 putative chemoreceptor glutamine deamidase CheD [Pseudomonas syringae pv. actinidiae]
MIKPVGVVEIVLAPGEVVFETRPARLRTLLGSCVAITFWHPWRRIGGMCHFMLPGRIRKGQPLDGKYADEALEMLISHALASGTLPEEYQVKLFGGGEMFPAQRHDQQMHNVADRNINAALTLADRHRLKLMAQDLGSTGHRNIIFDLWNGNVWVRHQPMEAIEKDAKQKNQRIAGR